MDVDFDEDDFSDLANENVGEEEEMSAAFS